MGELARRTRSALDLSPECAHEGESSRLASSFRAVAAHDAVQHVAVEEHVAVHLRLNHPALVRERTLEHLGGHERAARLVAADDEEHRAEDGMPDAVVALIIAIKMKLVGVSAGGNIRG